MSETMGSNLRIEFDETTEVYTVHDSDGNKVDLTTDGGTIFFSDVYVASGGTHLTEVESILQKIYGDKRLSYSLSGQFITNVDTETDTNRVGYELSWATR